MLIIGQILTTSESLAAWIIVLNNGLHPLVYRSLYSKKPSLWHSVTGLFYCPCLVCCVCVLQLVEPSIADSNCKSRCEEQDISYFRLNPRLEQVVGSGETDMQILITMIIQANKEMNERNEMSDLILHFHRLSEAARKMHAQINGEEHDTDTSTVIDGSKSETPSGEFN